MEKCFHHWIKQNKKGNSNVLSHYFSFFYFWYCFPELLDTNSQFEFFSHKCKFISRNCDFIPSSYTFPQYWLNDFTHDLSHPACCSGSLSPVIWDGNWVKCVSCVLHSCKHAPHRRDPCRKISLVHTPGTFGLLIWPSVHMTEDRSSLQRCVAHKQNRDGVKQEDKRTLN